MSLSSKIIGRLLKLPPAQTPNVTVKRDIKIPMQDGVVLLADHYSPQSNTKLPTILVRSPYGRGGFSGLFFGMPFAERGYQVLVQSTRGTSGSGGEFVFARHEHEDGLATIEWLKKQDWFSGELAMTGASYLGFVQWAIASTAGPELKALTPFVTTSDFNHFRYQGGAFTLETILAWSTMMTKLAKTGQTFRSMLGEAKRQSLLDKAYNYLPLKEADQVVVGKSSRTFQDTLNYAPEDDYWKAVNYSHTVSEVAAPVSMTSGWYDLFLYWQLRDYQALCEAGKQPYLLIGPWFHGQLGSFGPNINESLQWFEAHLKGNKNALRKNPVRLFVMGSNRWENFAAWPPPAKPEKWYLQPNSGLTKELPPASAPDRYRYNPADPTPAVGGNSLGKYMGQKDNRELESREDVLVYSSSPLKQDLKVIGPIEVELFVSSSLEHTDFFARLCVVKKSGKSLNLCDGILRLAPDTLPESAKQTDDTLRLKLELWPTAYHFKAGERIRVQISSGAHPRFSRNPGSGEPIGEETTLKLAGQQIYHDPQHPSFINLPVVTG